MSVVNLIAFIVAIIVIVAIHEYGHYLAMRIFGVRVLTFSIGFGPKLLGWKNKAGTDFKVAAIPLGGFVKPLDRRDGEIEAHQLSEEFSGKPAWQRVITYAAGPLANLLLAVFLFWLMMLGGERGRVPYLDQPVAGSAADQAGLRADDEILAMGDHETQNWSQVMTALLDFAGERGMAPVVVRGADGQQRTTQLPLSAWADAQQTHPMVALGLKARPFRPLVGEVSVDSAAERAGLQSGDLIQAVDGKPVSSWQQWVAIIQANPRQALEHTLLRDDQLLTVILVPSEIERDGRQVGFAGISADVADMREIHYGPLSALVEAVARVGDQSATIIGSIGKLLTGQLSVKTLGGPLTIADAAGSTASVGLMAFVGFLAFLSISLGVINLLPVPMLDGGWIVFGVIEMMIGRSLPERFLMAAQSVGLVMVLCLMVVAIFNDLVRHFA